MRPERILKAEYSQRFGECTHVSNGSDLLRYTYSSFRTFLSQHGVPIGREELGFHRSTLVPALADLMLE